MNRATIIVIVALAAAGGACGAGIVPPGPLGERLPANGNGRPGRAAILPVTDRALDARDMPADKIHEPVAGGLQACAAEAPDTLIGPGELDGAVTESGGSAGLNMEVGRRLLGGSGGRAQWSFARQVAERLDVRYVIVPVWIRIGALADSSQYQNGGAGRRRDRSVTLQAELWDGQTGERVAVTSSGGMSFDFEGGIGYSAVWLPIGAQRTLQAAVRDACTDVVVRLLRR